MVDMTRTVASALNSRFDYAKAVLYGTSENDLVKLQRAQNVLARVVTFTKRMDRIIRPVMQKLHWQPLET